MFTEVSDDVVSVVYDRLGRRAAARARSVVVVGLHDVLVAVAVVLPDEVGVA